MSWLAAITHLVDLAVPSTCAGCERLRGPLCPGCRREIAVLGGGAGTVRAALVQPDPLPLGMPSTWATATLTPLLSALLTAYKDEGRRDLAAELASLLAVSVQAARGAGEEPLVLVPVPTAERARRRRGDRPLEQLAVSTGSMLPGRVRVVRAVRHRRAVADQSSLSSSQRRLNLADAFESPGEAAALLASARVVLVDDIVTTGSTLLEGARALRDHGCEPVAACIAATTRHRRPQVVAPLEAD